MGMPGFRSRRATLVKDQWNQRVVGTSHPAKGVVARVGSARPAASKRTALDVPPSPANPEEAGWMRLWARVGEAVNR